MPPLTAPPPPENQSREYEKLPAGTHLARCIGVIDLGEHQTQWQNDAPKMRRQVYLKFEVPHERITWTFNDEEREGPMVIGTTLTFSMHERAKLRDWIEKWRGAKFSEHEAYQFDCFKLLGQPCTLTVVHNEAQNGNVYANIGGITGVSKGVEVPAQENQSLAYTPGDSEKAEALDRMSKRLREKCLVGHGLADAGATNGAAAPAPAPAPAPTPPPPAAPQVQAASPDDHFDDEIPF